MTDKVLINLSWWWVICVCVWVPTASDEVRRSISMKGKRTLTTPHLIVVVEMFLSRRVYMRSLIRRLGGASPLSRPSTLTDAAQWCQFPSETTYTFSLMPRLSHPSSVYSPQFPYLLACLSTLLLCKCDPSLLMLSHMNCLKRSIL